MRRQRAGQEQGKCKGKDSARQLFPRVDIIQLFLVSLVAVARAFNKIPPHVPNVFAFAFAFTFILILEN